jgi:signal transduction histidine kinase
MTIRRFLFSLIFLLYGLNVQARDLVIERGWVEDSAGNMTIEEAKQAIETPLTRELFSKGYSNSVFWIRLRIDPSQLIDQSTESLVVRIRPPYQDRIWIYDSLASRDKVRVTGDYYDWADDEYRSLNLNFIIPVGSEPRDIWLRVKAAVSTLTFIEVMTEEQVRAADRLQELATMLYLSALLICFGWAALTRINNKDKLLSYYLIREAVVIVYALAILGYIRIFTSGLLPSGWLDTFTTLISFFFITVVIWFDWNLISEFKPNRWLARLHISLVLFFPIAAALVLMGKTNEAVRLSSLIVLATISLALISAISTRVWTLARNGSQDSQPICSKTFLVLLYAFVAAIALLHRLPIMGMFSGSEHFVYLNLVYPLVTSIVLMVFIQIRVYRLSKYQQQKDRRLEIAEVEVQAERVQRVEQANFLKMLAHEMKTPLSVVRMAVGSTSLPPRTHEVVDRAVTDMDSIIERLLQVERLEDKKLSVNHDNFDLLDIVKRACMSLSGGERVHISAPAEVQVHSDQEIVRVIVFNLLENALKYSPEDSAVNISLIDSSNKVCFSVENQVGSAGFPSPDQVFEKYYRSALARQRTGSGLGLYLVKSLASLLGGHVEYAPSIGFICFKVEIPRQNMKV